MAEQSGTRDVEFDAVVTHGIEVFNVRNQFIGNPNMYVRPLPAWNKFALLLRCEESEHFGLYICSLTMEFLVLMFLWRQRLAILLSVNDMPGYAPKMTFQEERILTTQWRLFHIRH